MKWLILAGLIGFCAANALSPGCHRLYCVDDDNIMLYGLYGNCYTFTTYPGQKYFDIVINGVDTPVKKIRVYGPTCQVSILEGFENQLYPEKWSSTVFGNGDVYENHFFDILREYQGNMDEAQYAQFMHDIEYDVEEGKVCHVIYYLLMYLDKAITEDFFQKYIYQYQYQHPYPVEPHYDEYNGKYNHDDVYKYGFYPYSEQYYNYPSYHKYFSYPYYKDNYYGKYPTQQPPWEKYEIGYEQRYEIQYPWAYEYPSPYYGKSHVFDYLAEHQYPWTWYNQYHQGYGYGPTYDQQYGYNCEN